MTASEIEALLGKRACVAIEEAVTRAFSTANNDPQKGLALRELLASMLAAVVATPPDGAVDRARLAADYLVTLVQSSVLLSRASAGGNQH